MLSGRKFDDAGRGLHAELPGPPDNELRSDSIYRGSKHSSWFAIVESMRLRLLIVDDDQAFLDVARATLNRDGLDVVGTATTPAAALADTEMLRPDCVLVNIRLRETSGFELVRQLVAGFPDLCSCIVLISARAEDDFAEMIRESPAVGFIAKSKLSARAVRELVPGSSPSTNAA